MDDRVLHKLSKLSNIICHKVDEFFESEITFRIKEDKSPVTIMDEYISSVFEEEFKESGYHFFSEEKDSRLRFPALIIDPIDGTKEFIKKEPEFCISFGLYKDPNLKNSLNFSWIYNPITKETCHSMESYAREVGRKDLYKGFVSKTEYSEGLYAEVGGLEFKAVGSIAYKLAQLVQGKCDFVITKKPKNIWDIMAGSHLCIKNRFRMISQDSFVTSLSDLLYNPYILWAHEDNIEEIHSLLKKSEVI